MWKLTGKYRFHVSVFALCVVVAFCAAWPLYVRVSKKLEAAASELQAKLENATGLLFSYEKMSPSILAQINLRGVTVTDSADNINILRVRSVSLRYSLLNLIRRDWNHAFYTLVINGAEINFNSEDDMKIVSRILSLARNGGAMNLSHGADGLNDAAGAGKVGDAHDEKNSRLGIGVSRGDTLAKITSFDPDAFSIELPVNVLLRNVSFHFSNNDLSADADIKRASFTYNNLSNNLRVMMSAAISSNFVKNNMSVSASLSADGTLTDGFKNSSVLLRLSRVDSSNFVVGAMNFIATYDDKNVRLRSFQNFLPFAVSLSYDIDEKLAKLNLSAEKFKPFSFVSIRNGKISTDIQSLTYTGVASLSYDVSEGKLSYNSDGRAFFSEGNFLGSPNLVYELYGDRQKITVPKLDFFGNGYSVSFSGSYVFADVLLDGKASVEYFAKNGILSSDFFFESRNRNTQGFLCFAPEIRLGDKIISAFELSLIPTGSAVDFRASVTDFSHVATDSNSDSNAGDITIDGSYIIADKYFQSSVSLSNLYLDSMAECAAPFADVPESLLYRLSPYVVTSDIYFSGGSGNVTYNVPYFLVANTTKENEAMLVSMDGSNSVFHVSNLNLLYGGKSITFSGQADISPDLSGAFFSGEMVAGSIPYRFNGNVFDGWLNVSGDYGFALQMYKNGKKLNGSFLADTFPISVSDALFSFSTDTNFAYDEENGISASVSRIEIVENGSKFAFMPRFFMSGNVTKYGAFFDSVSYSDRYSSMDGALSVFVNSNDGIFSSAHIEANVSNPLSNESVAFFADASNHLGEKLSITSLSEEVYFNAECVINKLGLSRFLGEINERNLLSANLTATGTIDNPFVSLSVNEMTGVISGTTFDVKGVATVEDKNLTVPDFNFRYGGISLENLYADISLVDFSGETTANFAADLGYSSMQSNVKLSFSDIEIQKNSFVPTAGIVTLSTDSVHGDMFTQDFSFYVSLMYGGGVAAITTSDNVGLSGWVDSGGTMSFFIPEDHPFSFSLNGSIAGGLLDIHVNNIVADMGKIFPLFDVYFFKFHEGIFKGGFTVNGLLADPEFSGTLVAENADFSLPTVVPEHITIPEAFLILDHNTFTIPMTNGHVRDTPAAASVLMALDRWRLDFLEIKVKTDRNVYAPVTLKIPYSEFSGLASVDLTVLFQDRNLNVSGTLYAKDARGNIDSASVTGLSFSNSNTVPMTMFNIQTDLRIVAGEHVSIFFNPILRCVLAPGATLNLKIDQETETYLASGNVNIKSGEISWLSRNFYLRSGSLQFSESTGELDPLVNIRAETRERDSAGKDVRIIMSVENQFLSSMTPRFSSVPSKSEREIQTLLGQVVIGDSNDVGEFLYAAGDYAFQSTLGRSFENSLRELLNFDIFSIRTMVVQNTLRQGLSGSITNTADWSVGNFLDNSTVYIGKYINDVIFVDALMRWTYDRSRANDKTTAGGIVFRPEIGLELESPLGNIRWSVAPNIDALMNDAFIPSTALTFSWKFSF